MHAVAYDKTEQTLGTGRLLPDGHMVVKLERRGQGIGAVILRALMDKAWQHTNARTVLNAQLQTEPFYQRFGFSRYGPRS